MAKVLVTGGAGFFGLHLVQALAKKGYVPIIYDLDKPEQDQLPNIQYIKGDIRNEAALLDALKDVDFVFHNAALVPISRATRKTYWSVNVEGTRKVLNACLQRKIKKVIFVSSSAPYGIPKELPITEKTPFNPVCNYGKSKIAAENICQQYRQKGLDIVILRPRTLIGKGRLGIFQILYSWIADNKKVYLIG
ncbi:NAD-dependent epimerase/dehydratase family protein, partial [bacterium]|nr:NAD-dependent epimerase/dehydratase family protein [bacterium]